ncbi:MAG: cytochrome c oxidase subunit 3 [Armatimonadota bacterium]|nr:cytochrome c oxidase subunit 3 [Armatimonadota bacterium]
MLASEWGGGRSPFAINWPKLMMWLFLLQDTLTFAGLLTGYWMLRVATPNWPPQYQIFNLYLVGFMTFVLICSSATMAVAVAASRYGDRRTTLMFLVFTIVGGLIFLGLQAYEWTHFIGEGARLSTNPWGVPLFSSSFFVITGFHGAHVLAGVIYLAITAQRHAEGRIKPESVEIAGLYWHFVDLVWVFIFTIKYLL